MIKKEKLETKQLYSKWDSEWSDDEISYEDLMGEPINMFCETCKNNQTFNCKKIVFRDDNITHQMRPITISNIIEDADKIAGVLTLKYICAHCHKFPRNFILKIYNDNQMEKIGQFPQLDMAIPKEIKSLNNKNLEKIYQRGKISENLGYGIGAFAYYRRIVELCINDLIDEIRKIIPEGKEEDYDGVIKKLKEEKIAKNRINLIKDTIVDTSIDGNPLSKIYEISSIGIHGLSDEECLEYAESLRTLLLYVIDEISRGKNKKGKFRKAMEKVNKLISTQN